MTSRHLYFKLLREDMKRKLWAAALLALALFFILPVAMAMVLPSYQPDQVVTLESVIGRRIDNARSMLGFGTNYPMVIAALLCAAVVMGISSFSYLHNKKQVDFYHSLPVKRDLWFFVHITSGIILTALIYLAAILMSFVVAAVNGVWPGVVIGTAVKGFFCNMLYYILFYMTVVLAMMMTGTRIAAILGIGVFFFYFPGLSGLVQGFYEVFFETYYYGAPNIWNQVVVKISPISALVTAVSERMTLANGLGAAGAIAILGLLSFFLYGKRPSEAAGKTMAFSWSKGIIKVLLVVVFGMSGGTFFYAIRNTLPWMVFGIIVGVVISHCVIEVIYCADFKKLFCHEKTMAACMTLSLVISLSFYFDLFRFDTYVPEESKVASASIDFKEDNWVIYGIDQEKRSIDFDLLNKSNVAETGAVLRIAEEGVNQLGRDWRKDRGDIMCTIPVRFTLKSGRKVYREYSMDLMPVFQEADQVYAETGYKHVLYPGLSLEAEEAAGNLRYRDIAGNAQNLKGSKEQRKAVYEAYCREMEAMTLAARTEEMPVGELLLISDENDEKIREFYGNGKGNRYDRSGWYDGFFYPVYPSFTETINALSFCGIQAGESLAPERIEEIQIVAEIISDNDYWEDEYGYAADYDWEYEEAEKEEDRTHTVTYTDPEDIRKIVESFSRSGYRDKNSLLRTSDYQVIIMMKGRTADEDSIRGYLILGRAPDFVERDFKQVK